MTRAARLDLRSFQQELASRLATKTAAQVESSRLGLVCAGERWLVRLADAGEVIAVPPIVRVPMTRSWFLGLANIRGSLYSVIDFAAFLGHEPVASGGARAPDPVRSADRRAERRHRRRARGGPAQSRRAHGRRRRGPMRPNGTHSAGPMPKATPGRKSISAPSRATLRSCRSALETHWGPVRCRSRG